MGLKRIWLIKVLSGAPGGPTKEMWQLPAQRDHPHAGFLPSAGQRHDERRDPRRLFSEHLVAKLQLRACFWCMGFVAVPEL